MDLYAFYLYYRPDYGGEQQQQQQHYPIQQYREPEFIAQPQPEQQQQLYNTPEYEQQQYQQSSPEVMPQQYQQQPIIPQSPRTYAKQDMSAMPTASAQGQYQEFADPSGYTESRQGRDAESTLYTTSTGSIRDSPTLDRARQSPNGFRQQSPIGTAITPTKQSSPKQEAPITATAAQPPPTKKSPSPPTPVTTEVVPPVTQINQTIRKEVTAPSTTSTARRGGRPPTLRSVTARARAAASSARGGNR